MRSLLKLILLLALTTPLSAQEPSVGEFNVEEVSGGLEVTVQMSARPGEKQMIKVPSEGVMFNVNATREVRESDLFSSGLAIDINGDGDIDDIHKLRKSNGHLYLGDLKVKAFSSASGWQKTGDAEVYRMDSGAPGFVLYEAAERLMVGADYGSEKAEFQSFEGPFLQVILLEPCDAPEGEPNLKMEDALHTLYAFEPGMSSPEPQWHRVQWMVVPANTQHTFRVEGKGDGVLVLSVNYSPEAGIRKRKIQVVHPLGL